MKRCLFGTRAISLFSCVWVAVLVLLVFLATGFAGTGEAAAMGSNSFQFGNGFQGNSAPVAKTQRPTDPVWLYERRIPFIGQDHDMALSYRPEPGKNRLQSFVHDQLQSLLGACGIYALVGGVGSKRASQIDSAAENAIWRGIKSTARSPDDTRRMSNFDHTRVHLRTDRPTPRCYK